MPQKSVKKSASPEEYANWCRVTFEAEREPRCADRKEVSAPESRCLNAPVRLAASEVTGVVEVPRF